MGAGPIDWDASLGGSRDIPQPEATELTEPQPWIVTPDEAAAFAEDTGWCVFPARVRVDEKRGKVEKLPAVAGSWNEVSSRDPVAVKEMWDERPQLIAVDCRKSGLVVFDADALPIDSDWWRDLTSTGTHVRRSVSGRGLHVFFTAPPDWDATTAVPGTWPYGEVKFRGYVVLANLPVVTPPEVKPLPDAIRRRLLDEHTRERGPGGRAGSYGSRELTLAELDEWLDEEQVLETGAPEVFLGRVVDRLRDKVRAGTPRRTATFEEVHVAAIESCAGLYTRRAAHDALLEAYRLMHDDDEWHRRRRELGYRRMWTYLAGADVAGSEAWRDVVSVARAERGLPSHEQAGQFEAWLAARRSGGAPESPADVEPGPLAASSEERAEAEASPNAPQSQPAPVEEAAQSAAPEAEVLREETPTPSGSVGETDAEGEDDTLQPTPEELMEYLTSRVEGTRVRDEVVRELTRQEARRTLGMIESARMADIHGDRYIPIDLGGDPPPLTPLDCWVRDDGVGIASSRQHAHLVIGTKASGKSWLMQYLLIEQALAGGRVAYLDWEMNAPDVMARLKALGGKPEINDSFRYFAMSGCPVGSQVDRIYEWEPTVVIVDSVVRAMGAEEDRPENYENSNPFFIEWISRIERLRAHASLFLIDHTGHAAPHRARGASAKLDQMDFGYTVEVTVPWSRSTPGSALIVARKSRAGELAQDEPCAEARVVPSAGGTSVDIQLLSPSPMSRLIAAGVAETTADADARRAIIKLMSDGAVRTLRQIRESVSGSNVRVKEQVDRLVAEGWLEPTGKGFVKSEGAA